MTITEAESAASPDPTILAAEMNADRAVLTIVAEIPIEILTEAMTAEVQIIIVLRAVIIIVPRVIRTAAATAGQIRILTIPEDAAEGSF